MKRQLHCYRLLNAQTQRLFPKHTFVSITTPSGCRGVWGEGYARGELRVGGVRGGGRASAHRDKLVFVCPFAAAATKTHFFQSRKAVMKSNEAAEEAAFDL